LEGDSVPALDDDVRGGPDSEAEAPAARLLERRAVLGQDRGAAGERVHHAGAEPHALGPRGRRRQRREGVVAARLLRPHVRVAGGALAGMEHDGGREGALRGVVGGSLFGGFILILHEATGKEAKADLPHPAALLLIVTVSAGAALGALGGRTRQRRAEAGEGE